ncbi:hypothetical protein KBD45_00915 [Candidatus Dojkabacteria bacterium]|nr:hypothetical protein [Candidatus Dojkabacteria bacterium]
MVCPYAHSNAEGAELAVSREVARQVGIDNSNLPLIIQQVFEDFPQLKIRIDSSTELLVPVGHNLFHYQPIRDQELNQRVVDNNSIVNHAVNFGSDLLVSYLQSGMDALDITYESRVENIREKTKLRYKAGIDTAVMVLSGLYKWVGRNNVFDGDTLPQVNESIIKFAREFMRLPNQWALYFDGSFSNAALDQSLELQYDASKNIYAFTTKPNSVLWNILRFKADSKVREIDKVGIYQHKNSADYDPFENEEQYHRNCLVLKERIISFGNVTRDCNADYYAQGILKGLRAIPEEFWLQNPEALEELRSGNFMALINPASEMVPMLLYDDSDELGHKIGVFPNAYHKMLPDFFLEGTALHRMLAGEYDGIPIANYTVFGFDPGEPEARLCPAIYNLDILKILARATGYKLIETIQRQTLLRREMDTLNVDPVFVQIIKDVSELIGLGVSQRDIGQIVFGERGKADATRSPGRRIGEIFEIVKQDLVDCIVPDTDLVANLRRSGMDKKQIELVCVRRADSFMPGVLEEFLIQNNLRSIDELSQRRINQFQARVWKAKCSDDFALRIYRKSFSDPSLAKILRNPRKRILDKSYQEIAEILEQYETALLSVLPEV